MRSHLDHAAHNERLLDIFESDLLPRHPEFLDWAVVVTFYAALHYTKAVLIRDHQVFARHHRGHHERHRGFVEGHNDFVDRLFPKEVGMAYDELFHRSIEARYGSFYGKRGPLSSLQQLALYRSQLETIKAACV